MRASPAATLQRDAICMIVPVFKLADGLRRLQHRAESSIRIAAIVRTDQ